MEPLIFIDMDLEVGQRFVGVVWTHICAFLGLMEVRVHDDDLVIGGVPMVVGFQQATLGIQRQASLGLVQLFLRRRGWQIYAMELTQNDVLVHHACPIHFLGVAIVVLRSYGSAAIYQASNAEELVNYYTKGKGKGKGGK